MHGNRYKWNVQDDDDDDEDDNDDDDDDDDDDDNDEHEDEDEDDEDETNLSRQTGRGLWALALVYNKILYSTIFFSENSTSTSTLNFGFSSPTEFSIDFQSVNWYQHDAYYGTHDITLYTLGADPGTLVVDEWYTHCR